MAYGLRSVVEPLAQLNSSLCQFKLLYPQSRLLLQVFDQALAGGGAKSINFQVLHQDDVTSPPFVGPMGAAEAHKISNPPALVPAFVRCSQQPLQLSQDLAADLAQITFDYPFSIPPYFALIIRAIGVLEGIALVGNPGVRHTPGSNLLGSQHSLAAQLMHTTVVHVLG